MGGQGSGSINGPANGVGPRFSIVINNYNYASFLDESIQSCLTQSYPHLEIIVVDDGSTDDSRRIIESYNGRILPVLKENGGQSSAFNAAFPAATGDWIWFLDSDDYLLPDAVRYVAENIPSAETALVYGQALRVDRQGNPLPRKFQHQEPVRRGSFLEALLNEGSIRLPATSCLIFNRPLLAGIMPIPEKRFSSGSDDYLRRRILFYGNGWGLGKPVCAYRFHAANDSVRNKKNWKPFVTLWCRESFAYHQVRLEALSRGLTCHKNRREIDTPHALAYIPIAKSYGRSATKAFRDLLRSFSGDPSFALPKKVAYLFFGCISLLLPAWASRLFTLKILNLPCPDFPAFFRTRNTE